MKNRPALPVLAVLAVLVAVNLTLPPDLRSQTCPDGGKIKPQTTVQEAIKAISVNLTNLCTAVPTLAKTQGRVVTVNSAGGADFTSVKAACDFVSSATKANTTRSIILVYNGAPSPSGLGGYDEPCFTVPTNTVLQGVPASGNSGIQYSGLPVINSICTAGSAVTALQNSALTNLTIQSFIATTGAMKLLDVTGSGVSVRNVNILGLNAMTDSFPVDLLRVAAGAFYSFDLSTNRSSPATLSRNVFLDTGAGASFYGGRHQAASGQLKVIESVATGTNNLWWVRVDCGSAVGLVKSGSGSLASHASEYCSSTGAIDDFGPREQHGTTLPVTCTVGQEFQLTGTAGGEQPCLCAAAGNAWNCGPSRFVPRNTPPFVCSSSTEGGVYYDLEDHELCVCKGIALAWTSLGAGACS